jgi:hypothetical protein
VRSDEEWRPGAAIGQKRGALRQNEGFASIAVEAAHWPNHLQAGE